jgi:hypothetical protein
MAAGAVGLCEHATALRARILRESRAAYEADCKQDGQALKHAVLHLDVGCAHRVRGDSAAGQPKYKPGVTPAGSA